LYSRHIGFQSKHGVRVRPLLPQEKDFAQRIAHDQAEDAGQAVK
jgi:hypothetical protein